MSEEALRLKNEGNIAFANGDHEKAIQFFSQGIEEDPTIHVLFSNRSASYASLGKYEEALKDAERVIQLKPDWPKGYSRKATALSFMQRYGEAAEVYEAGLKLDPENAQMKEGLQQCAQQMNSQMGNIFGQLFGPDLEAKIATNPKLQGYMEDPEFAAKVKALRENPQANMQVMLQTMQTDNRFQELLSFLLGIPEGAMGGAGGAAGPAPEPGASAMPEPAASQPPPQPAPTQPSTSKPASPPEPELSPEEKEEAEKKEKAVSLKEKGNQFYKKREFESALEAYNEAVETCPTIMTFRLNKAAALLELEKYAECREVCLEAVTIGRANKADYKDIAKAFARVGAAYMREKDYDNSLGYYNKSLTEHRFAPTLKKVQEVEKLKAAAEKEAYIDPEKSIEARTRGNEFFKNNKYPEAIKEYTEAIARDPKDHVPLSNRAAAYTKMMDYNRAIKDCDACLALNPNFIKAYSRKGHAQFFAKQYHKCLESYQAGLALDPNNAELNEGVQRTIAKINEQQNAGVDEEQVKRAMEDPEIQSILQDPAFQAAMQQMQQNPAASQQLMQDPVMREKITKLIAAGVIKTGPGPAGGPGAPPHRRNY